VIHFAACRRQCPFVWTTKCSERCGRSKRPAAALRRHEALRAEVATLDADEEDRREMQEVASLMESLRAEG
jgi:hypothetical protein